jgi:hypothetical protein
MSVVIGKLNCKLSGVSNVKVTWAGTDIHRRVGHHYVETMVKRRISVNMCDREGGNENANTSSEESCFVILMDILDTNECTLPVGHAWHHQYTP